MYLYNSFKLTFTWHVKKKEDKNYSCKSTRHDASLELIQPTSTFFLTLFSIIHTYLSSRLVAILRLLLDFGEFLSLWVTNRLFGHKSWGLVGLLGYSKPWGHINSFSCFTRFLAHNLKVLEGNKPTQEYALALLLRLEEHSSGQVYIEVVSSLHIVAMKFEGINKLVLSLFF